MKFQTRGAVSWLRKSPKELVHGWTSMASSMSGSSLFQGARQVPDGSWLQRAVHTGWGSGEALSCCVRMVADARDKNRDTREGGRTASVPPLKSNRKVVKATWFSGSSVRPFPGACLLVSWVRGRPWPLAIRSGSVCWSGPVVRFSPSCFVWFRPPGLFQKRGDDPGHRPKDRVVF